MTLKIRILLSWVALDNFGIIPEKKMKLHYLLFAKDVLWLRCPTSNPNLELTSALLLLRTLAKKSCCPCLKNQLGQMHRLALD